VAASFFVGGLSDASRCKIRKIDIYLSSAPEGRLISWSEKDENHNLIQGEEGGKLKKKLEENGFQITSAKIEKFSMFICIKK
jgi:hypothetical protein